MSAILSAVQPTSDIDDVTVRLAVEGFASEEALTARAESAFDFWWGGLDDIDHRVLPEEFCRAMYVAGYLSMARELGQLPKGGAA